MACARPYLAVAGGGHRRDHGPNVQVRAGAIPARYLLFRALNSVNDALGPLELDPEGFGFCRATGSPTTRSAVASSRTLTTMTVDASSRGYHCALQTSSKCCASLIMTSIGAL